MQRERRERKRYTTNIPGEVYIVLLEETFQPQKLQGIILNLSLTGMKLLITDIDPDLVKKLMRPERFIKVIFVSPMLQRKLQLIGKIVWLNYFSEEHRLETGLLFEELAPQTHIHLTYLLQFLEAEQNKETQ